MFLITLICEESDADIPILAFIIKLFLIIIFLLLPSFILSPKLWSPPTEIPLSSIFSIKLLYMFKFIDAFISIPSSYELITWLPAIIPFTILVNSIASGRKFKVLFIQFTVPPIKFTPSPTYLLV